MENILHLFVWTNADGVLVCPWMGSSPESQKRVLVDGGPLNTMSNEQLKALVALAFRDPGVCKGKDAAIFYNGNDWNDKGCPYGSRGEQLLVLELHD